MQTHGGCMPEKTTVEKCFYTEYHCDKCEPSKLYSPLTWNGKEEYLADRMMYQHVCKRCDAKYFLDKIYPEVKLDPKPDPVIAIKH